MKTISLLLAALCMLPVHLLAQLSGSFLPVAKLTDGPFDDSHAIFQQNPFYLFEPGVQCVVFERRTDSASMIAVKRFLNSPTVWDSAASIVSSCPPSQNQSSPDVAGLSLTGAIVIWQRQLNSVWNVFLSWRTKDSSSWQPAMQITNDSISCTHPRVGAVNDSLYLLIWSRRNLLLCSSLKFSSSFSNLTISTPETLAVTNDDSLEYDANFRYSTATAVWTDRDTAGIRFAVSRTFDYFPNPVLSAPETLRIRGTFSHPQFAFPSVGFFGPIFYEAVHNGLHDVHYLVDSYDESISNDSTADYRNPKAYLSPLITTGPRQQTKEEYFWSDILVMERTRGAESSLLFENSSRWVDTISSEGYNRNASICPALYYAQQYLSECLPIVWESNRDGRSHLYTRVGLVTLGAVKTPPVVPRTTGLDQNYPNPFNPATTIRFHLTSFGHVRLSIFDIMGREVQTLINQNMGAGQHDTRWDGSRYASGVYFCRLNAGSYVETRKLVLLK